MLLSDSKLGFQQFYVNISFDTLLKIHFSVHCCYSIQIKLCILRECNTNLMQTVKIKLFKIFSPLKLKYTFENMSKNLLEKIL